MSAPTFGETFALGPRNDAAARNLMNELEAMERERDRLEDRIRWDEEDLEGVEHEIDRILKAMDALDAATDDQLEPPYGAPLVPPVPSWWNAITAV